MTELFNTKLEKINNSLNDGGYSQNSGKIYKLLDKDKNRLMIGDKLIDFYIQKGTSYDSPGIYYLRFERAGLVVGNKPTVIDKISNMSIGSNKKNTTEVLEHLDTDIGFDVTERYLVGGFKTKAEMDLISINNNMDVKTINEVLDWCNKYLTDEHKIIFKYLLLSPFIRLLRDDHKYPREVVKACILEGKPKAFKTGLINLCRNVYDETKTINFNESPSVQSMPGLRNKLNSIVGINLVDESNSKILSQKSNFKREFEDLIKLHFDKNLPQISSDTTGTNLMQENNSLLCITWNDRATVVHALKDRLIKLWFDEDFKTEEDIREIYNWKTGLVDFGKLFINYFKEDYDYLMNIDNPNHMINHVLEKINTTYNIQLDWLIDVEIIYESEVSTEWINDLWKEWIYYYQDNGEDIDEFNRLSYVHSVNKNSVLLYQTRFTKYVATELAHDSGISNEHILKAIECVEPVESNYGNSPVYLINIKLLEEQLSRDKYEKLDVNVN